MFLKWNCTKQLYSFAKLFRKVLLIKMLSHSHFTYKNLALDIQNFFLIPAEEVFDDNVYHNE